MVSPRSKRPRETCPLDPLYNSSDIRGKKDSGELPKSCKVTDTWRRGRLAHHSTYVYVHVPVTHTHITHTHTYTTRTCIGAQLFVNSAARAACPLRLGGAPLCIMVGSRPRTCARARCAGAIWPTNIEISINTSASGLMSAMSCHGQAQRA